MQIEIKYNCIDASPRGSVAVKMFPISKFSEFDPIFGTIPQNYLRVFETPPLISNPGNL